MSSSITMREPSMLRGGTGMASSSSLSRAEKSCCCAVNTLPMKHSAKAVSAAMAK